LATAVAFLVMISVHREMSPRRKNCHRYEDVGKLWIKRYQRIASQVSEPRGEVMPTSSYLWQIVHHGDS